MIINQAIGVVALVFFILNFTAFVASVFNDRIERSDRLSICMAILLLAMVEAFK